MHDLKSQPPSIAVETPRDNSFRSSGASRLHTRVWVIALLAVTATLAAGCTGPLLPSAASSNQSACPTAPEGAVPRLRPQLVATNRAFLDTSAGRDAQKKMDMGGSEQKLKTSGDKPDGSEQKPVGATMPGMDPAMPGMNPAMPGMNGAQPTGSAKQPTPAAEPTPVPLKP